MVYLDIEQIKINIDTGITGKKENIILTSKILYHPTLKDVNASEYPFILSNLIYPIKELESFFYQKNDYNEKVKFFFNKLYATKILENILKNKKTVAPTDESKDDNELNDIFTTNVPFMLKMLFPTTFPFKNNITTSFDEYILNNNNNSTSFLDMYSHNYSYLNVNSKKYTVLKVTWLNDMINNTLYKDMITAFNDYKNWSASSKDKLIKKNKANIDSLLKKMSNTYNIYSYKEQFENNQIKKEDETSGDSRRVITTEDKKIEFYDNLKSIISDIESLHNYITSLTDTLATAPKPEPNIKKLLSSINTIKDTYKRLQSNSRVTLKNIDNDFIKKIDKNISELETLDNFNIIQRYLDIDTNNKNFEKEDSSIKSELKKYPKFIEFVNKLKSITVNKSTNSDLNDIIRNYYENIPEDTKMKFNELMNETITRFIELKNISFKHMDFINVGASIVEDKDTYKKSYEIFIAIDLLEGEYNDTNIGKITCNYKGLLLGNLAENYIENNNFNLQKLFELFVPEIKKENPKKENPKKEKK